MLGKKHVWIVYTCLHIQFNSMYQRVCVLIGMHLHDESIGLICLSRIRHPGSKTCAAQKTMYTAQKNAVQMVFLKVSHSMDSD